MIDMVEIDGRRWYVKDKVRYPSASSVLDILFPNGKDFVREEHLAMGTLCHKEISEALIRHLNMEPYGAHPDPSVASRVESGLEYVTRKATTSGDILAVESRILYMGVGMTPDVVLLDSERKKIVIDWKFAESTVERYYYQLEIYQRAENADRGIIVRIDREGKVYPTVIDRDERRWEKIKSAINVRNHLDERIKTYV